MPKLYSIPLVFILAQGVSNAMPGMHGSGGGAATEQSRVSNSLGGKINSPGSEMEITYSADGKTAIFVSTREGSVQSPGGNYSFDIWISHQVDGEWQSPIHLGPGIDPKVGPNINTSAWALEPSFSDDGNVIYFTRYEAGNMLSGDLYVVQKVDGVWQKPESLGAKINSPQRDHDEWIAQQNADGEWQQPVNLGDAINTGGEDMCWTFTPDGKKFTGSWGPHGTYDMDIRWVNKNDVPLLKDFEPIGPPPNLLKNSKTQAGGGPAVNQ